jgi:hypothetical protein
MEWPSSLVNDFLSTAKRALLEYKKNPDNADKFEALMMLNRAVLPTEIIPISIPGTADCEQPQQIPFVLPRVNDWMLLKLQGGFQMRAFSSVKVTPEMIDQKKKKYMCLTFALSDLYINHDFATNNTNFPPFGLQIATISESLGLKKGMFMNLELEVENSASHSRTTSKIVSQMGFSKDRSDIEIDADCMVHSFRRRSHCLYDINIRIKYIPMF